MSDSEEIEVNASGGKQSKLYTAYHAIDPWAMHALACTLHRGKVKYGLDNWRKIPTEEHINHAMHHLMSVKQMLTRRRLKVYGECPPNDCQEDQLAHAFCRVMFALGKEIEVYGQHPEHSDPFYHEPKTPPVEPDPIRGNRPSVSGVSTIAGIITGERSTTALPHKRRRNSNKRTSKVGSGTKTGVGISTVHSPRRRG